MTRTIYGLMENWGYEPTVYRSEIGLTLTRKERLKKVIRRFGLREAKENDMRLRIAPPLGLPLWLFYLAPHFLFSRHLAQDAPIFVTSGSAHVALPLAIRRIPYVLWIATLYEDELRAKADLGDVWAYSLLESPGWSLLRKQEKMSIQGAARVLALSSNTAKRICETYPEAADQVRIVGFPVDTKCYRPDPEVRKASANEPYLMLAARINDPRKNVAVLLHAFRQVCDRRPDIRLVLAGEEPAQAVTDLVEELGLMDRVVFRGLVTSEALIRLYQGAQLFVLPSSQEGLGIVLLEAMACGTPVVATRCGGPEDIVTEKTGRLVPVGDAPALAEAILDLLERPEALDEMRKTCVDFVASESSLAVIEPKLRDAFEATAMIRYSGRLSQIRRFVAGAWILLVLVIYVLRQMMLHWASIEARIINPLLNLLP